MPEEPNDASLPATIQASLRTIAAVLREPHPLSVEAQEALAGLMDELGNVVTAKEPPPEAVRRLADSTARLVQAVHRRADAGLVVQARDRVEQAIIGAEAHAPLVAGVARRLLDALANIGI
jgi:hypothetical protein